jgi:UDP:flavonoid glycosyltransferase YjiC (YdhE family)
MTTLRVLFSVRPFRGHLHPLIPLAREFQRAGHHVAVATGDDLAPIVANAGLTWFPAGFNPRESGEVVDIGDNDYGYDAVRQKVEDLLDISLGQFQPDVVIREPTDLAPSIASEIVGAVHVTFGVATFIPVSSWRSLQADQTITHLRHDYGLPEDPELTCLYRGLYLAVIPHFMEEHAPLPVPEVHDLRYIPWAGDTGGRPVAPPPTTDRPKILVTLGTVYNVYADLLACFLAALAEEPVDVVCTLGDRSGYPTASAPTNVRFEGYLPHSLILPGCRALLCHAGFNTVMGAIAEGVPLVCVPIGSDQEYNARMCAEHGLGVSVAAGDATPELIRAAVRRVLHEPSFADNVRALREKMRRVPGPDVAVAHIAELAARRPRTRNGS